MRNFCSKNTLVEGEKKGLQQAAQAKVKPTTEEYEDILKGLLGNPKGFLHVC